LNGLIFAEGSDGPSARIIFKDNKVSILFPYNGGTEINNTNYSFSIINGIYRITIFSDPRIELYLLFDNEFGYFSITSPFKYDSGILLRITNEIIPKLPRGGGEPFLYAIFKNLSIKTSSFLRENEIEYNGENLEYLFTTYPWVEGKRDAGIGEYIEFDYSQTYNEKVDTIVMSNGYFFPNNTDLYYQNNRVKRIKVEEINGNYKQEFEVKDTPNLQTFKLNGFYSKLRITILDVYYGNNFNDTCINHLTGVKLYIKP
jgi:hypothetical protein